MEPIRTFQDPLTLLRSAEQQMEGIPSVKLFNDPQYQKLTESWCAAMVGVGYSTHLAPSLVAVNEGPYRQDVDIYLRVAKRDWEFQLAEVQEPGRRRGLEFKQFADGTARNVPYDAERGKLEGPGWLAEGVKRKISKRYAASHQLNLLLYANFSARDMDYPRVVEALAKFESDFASIWVVSSLHLCSVFSPAALGEIKGWGSVRSVEDYYS